MHAPTSQSAAIRPVNAPAGSEPDAESGDLRGLRVAALIDTAIVSGPGRQLAALASRLEDHGIALRVFMFQRASNQLSPYIAYLERAGIEHVVLQDRGPFDLRLLSELSAALREWQPHVVQSHNYRTTALAYLLNIGNPAWTWIAFFHGSTSESWKVRVYNRIDSTLLPRAKRLVVMSERHRQQFRSAGDKVRVIYNAVLPLPSEGSPVDLHPLRREGVPLIGVIGRLSQEKGVDILLEAAALLPLELFSLVIAGDGPERANLESQVQRLGLASNVHFLGAVRDVGSLYPQLDLVVLPSRSEGLPNVLLEALSADVPLVATAVGAVPEVLDDPIAASVVPPNDPHLLAEAIEHVLANGRTAEAMRARAEAAVRFSLNRRVDQHLRLYRELGLGRPFDTVHRLERVSQ